MAFLLALERLSPLERAVFLLHDVFDTDYPDVAETLHRSEAACRQLAARAREHVRQAQPRFQVARDEAARLAVAFMEAARRNDLDALKSLLAEDAVMITDGGGKRGAALRPLIGREDVMAFIHGLAWRQGWPAGAELVRLARINGYAGRDPQDRGRALHDRLRARRRGTDRRDLRGAQPGQTTRAGDGRGGRNVRIGGRGRHSAFRPAPKVRPMRFSQIQRASARPSPA